MKINSSLFVLRHYGVFIELTRREFSSRYKASFGGIFWSFLQPLFLLTIYTVAFGVILKARWGFSGGTLDYAFLLFAGLIVYNTFSEVLNKSSTLIIGNSSLVKKVIFPIELLPVVTTAVSLIHAVIGVAIWIVCYTLFIGTPKLTLMMIPSIFICMVPLLLGFSWLIASIGVFLRDLSHIVGMLTHALLFLTPIFYSIDAAPAALHKILLLNPLTFLIEQVRLILYYGQMPALKGLATYFILASVFSFLCFCLFKRLRPSFADNV
jgi:lipopolysaccharide transport system permease protein